MIDLSIIIVNWNVCGLLCRCLHSIVDGAIPRADAPFVWQLGHTGSQTTDGRDLSAGRASSVAPGLSTFEFEVLVIDSASTDDSVETVRQEFPGVRLYSSETNLGYTGGNNLGIRESRGRYVLVLNPDTEVLANALGTMLSYMDGHPRVGVVGPQMLWPDGSVQPSRRRFPTLCTALVESSFLQKWFPHHPIMRRYYVLDRPDRVVSEVDWVQGACLMVRREVIDQVGVLDEAYFMYSEELDWQRRIAAAGWKVVYLPSAQIVHYEGKSSEQAVALRHIRFSRSKVRYFGKHHGSLAGQIVRGWLLFNYLYEWIIEALKWCLGHKRDLRRERMRAYGQVLRSRLSL